MKFKNKLITLVVAFLAAISFALPSQVNAAKGDQGVDWSRYQGDNGVFGYSADKFGISQIGGYSGYGTYEQTTYKTQVASLIAAGKRAHTYIWWQNINDTNLAKQVLDHFLPDIQTPKGSIVALDYEAGSTNTATLLWALNYIRDAGYTPMLYGYKSFLMSHIDLSQIASHYQLWLAEYPDYNVTTIPNYGYFPSFDNVGIFQFTSTYRAGGLDGNVDLTGITDSGYNGSTTTGSGKTYVKPSTDTPATNAGQQANNTTLSQIKAGDSVKVNFGTTRWANGVAMPSWVQGKTYTVQQVSGSNVLLGGIMSWINRSNVELLTTTSVSSVSSGSTYTVQSGDSWWSIAYRYGMSMYTLASNNGKSIYSVIHPGDVLRVSGGYSVSVSSHTYYTVHYGDSFWSIANKYGISMYTLAANNGKSIYSLIYPGESLYIR
ncbi:LysM peptidoglycan-binding domain-containing protein [Lacticaseibacillus paracasei]|uniref:LysM peptidoglycan-binding domain-containing protein n=1 Tax=Lacticaseibacillus paracasei TaxID=1597 RepID=UPI000E09753F|nr:LysM peptidoglycan-binding domain-containing protein [Lacticaseibacillus paracasei]RDF86019.1 1,4-beta-N-acetylmuramidase [Lacticaseibacillus paracasei]RNE28521.1 Muramidase-2 precursor [Lacticaseibacillus paracasei]TEA87861.1 1,4-beta-N-acetylmuramidase [Lacticaseibacillus paracasei]